MLNLGGLLEQSSRFQERIVEGPNRIAPLMPIENSCRGVGGFSLGAAACQEARCCKSSAGEQLSPFNAIVGHARSRWRLIR